MNELKLEPFIKYDSNVSCKDLTEIDSLIYANLAYNANNETRESFVSTDTIVKRLTISYSTLIDSINKLEKMNLIKVSQRKSINGNIMNVYTFPVLDKDFIMMSKRFLDLDIDNKLKAFLIKIHPWLDTRIEGMRAKLTASYIELAIYLDCQVRTVKKKIDRLISLGIIEDETIIISRKRYNSQSNMFIFNLPAMKQEILKLKERVDEHDVILDSVVSEQKAMREEIAYLKKMLNYKNTEISNYKEAVHERSHLKICN